MGIGTQCQAEVASVVGPVIGLRLGTKHRLHQLRFVSFVVDVFQKLVEEAGRNDLSKRQLLA